MNEWKVRNVTCSHASFVCIFWAWCLWIHLNFIWLFFLFWMQCMCFMLCIWRFMHAFYLIPRVLISCFDFIRAQRQMLSGGGGWRQLWILQHGFAGDGPQPIASTRGRWDWGLWGGGRHRGDSVQQTLDLQHSDPPYSGITMYARLLYHGSPHNKHLARH